MGRPHVLPRTKRYRLTCLFLFLFLFLILVLIFSFYCFSFFFFLLDSVDQLLLARTTPLPTTINTICTTNGPVRWLPSQMVDHHLLLLLLLLLLRLVLCCDARSSSTSSSACCCNHACYRSVIGRRQRQRQRSFGGVSSSIPGSTTTHTKVNVAAAFGQKMSPAWAYFTKFSPAVPTAGRTRARTSNAPWVAKTAWSVLCTPTTAPRL